MAAHFCGRMACLCSGLDCDVDGGGGTFLFVAEWHILLYSGDCDGDGGTFLFVAHFIVLLALLYRLVFCDWLDLMHPSGSYNSWRLSTLTRRPVILLQGAHVMQESYDSNMTVCRKLCVWTVCSSDGIWGGVLICIYVLHNPM